MDLIHRSQRPGQKLYRLKWNPFKLSPQGHKESCVPTDPTSGATFAFPHEEDFFTVEDAAVAGSIMFRSCVLSVKCFSECAGADILVCEQGNMEPVFKDVIMRGWLVCPKCGNIYPKNKTAFHPTVTEDRGDQSMFMYDRANKAVVAVPTVLIVSMVECTACGASLKVDEVAPELDNAFWSMLGIDCIGMRGEPTG